MATLLMAPQAGAASPPAKPVATKSAKPAKGAPKAPSSRSSLKNQAVSQALAVRTVEAISVGQMDVAARVLVGDADCEFNQSVNVTPVEGMPGYFNVTYLRKQYRMLPRETSTGAVRLEDPDAGIVWLQIPAKSMLMNTKIGQRMIDACMHATQRAEQLKVAAVGQGIGIAPAVGGLAAASTSVVSPGVSSEVGVAVLPVAGVAVLLVAGVAVLPVAGITVLPVTGVAVLPLAGLSTAGTPLAAAPAGESASAPAMPAALLAPALSPTPAPTLAATLTPASDMTTPAAAAAIPAAPAASAAAPVAAQPEPAQPPQAAASAPGLPAPAR